MTTAQRLALLPAIHLSRGVHRSTDKGMCVKEAAAWLVGEPHSDWPKCVSVVLRAPLVKLNDGLDDKPRQKLLSIVPRILGTRDDGKDEARRWLATDWLLRVHTPAWLDTAGMTARAADIRALPRVCDHASLRAAKKRLEEESDYSDMASAGARDEIGKTAKTAANYAAKAAVGDLSLSAASASIVVLPEAYSAELFAEIAAKMTVVSAAAHLAKMVVELATYPVAVSTGASGADWDIAARAADNHLWPTRLMLRESVFTLIDDMIDPPNKQGEGR